MSGNHWRPRSNVQLQRSHHGVLWTVRVQSDRVTRSELSPVAPACRSLMAGLHRLALDGKAKPTSKQQSSYSPGPRTWPGRAFAPHMPRQPRLLLQAEAPGSSTSHHITTSQCSDSDWEPAHAASGRWPLQVPRPRPSLQHGPTAKP